MITSNLYIRDTLIRLDVLNSLPQENIIKINELVKEFNNINYIDARTQLGPDQISRMSKKQHEKLTSNATKVFSIEMQIKQLLKPLEQVKSEEIKKRVKELEQNISSCESYINHINSLGSMIRTKNGKIKISYQRGLDDHEERKAKAENELLILNK